MAAVPPAVKLQIKKRCEGGLGAAHDLTHYAVETTLGLRQGFYGLLAQGWDIPGFEAKGTARQLPDEVLVTECIVGQLTNIVFAGRAAAAGELNAALSPALLPGASPGDSTRGLHSPAGAGLAWRRPNLTGGTPQQVAGNVSTFNWLVRSAVDGVRPGAAMPGINAEILRQMRHTLDVLLARWRALPPGGTLE